MSSLTKGQKRLLIVLAVVLAYGIFDVVSNKDSYFSYYKGKKNERKIEQSNMVASNVAEIKKTSATNAAYLQAWGDDPFYNQRYVRRAATVRAQSEVQLNLKAISYGNESSVVMINDRILTVGDVIHGYRITRIDPTRVLLIKDGENKILTIR